MTTFCTNKENEVAVFAFTGGLFLINTRFSFPSRTQHHDVHHKSLEMFIGVCLCMEVLAASCCCRSYTLCAYIIHNSDTLMVHFVSLFVVSICLLHIVLICNTNIATSIDSNSCTTTTLSIWYSSHFQVT